MVGKSPQRSDNKRGLVPDSLVTLADFFNYSVSKKRDSPK